MSGNKLYYSEKKQKDIGKYIFLIVIIVVLIVLFWQNTLADKQDEILLNDYSEYQQADQMMQNQLFDESIKLLTNLNSKYNNDYQLNYRLAYSYLYSGNTTTANVFYTKALDINPYLVENIEFMYQYAIVLAKTQQYDNALIVIDRILTYPIDESKRVELNEMINTINAERGTAS